MSIEGLVGGIMIIVASIGNGESSKALWNTAVLIDKVGTKSQQGTWGASAHEEFNQAIKDSILKVGQR
jgi:hypothetical protein